jgi:hypothetical protein
MHMKHSGFAVYVRSIRSLEDSTSCNLEVSLEQIPLGSLDGLYT